MNAQANFSLRLMGAILALCLLAPLQLSGQAGTGLLAPNRMIDWSNAGAGAIPSRTTVCASLTSSATPAAVQSALSSCPSGQTVLLAAGTYTWSSSLVTQASNVTLRGAGPTQTILKFTGTSSNCNGLGPVAFCVWNGDSNSMQYSNNVLLWTAGSYAKGSTTLTLGGSPGSICGGSYTSSCPGSVSNLHVGSLLGINQLDDASDTGNMYMCSGTTNCSQQGVANAWKGRVQTQLVTVTGISGSNVTFSPGLYAPQWTSGKTPIAYYSSVAPVTGFGLENLQINTQSIGEIQAMFETFWVTNSWVKNVSFVNNDQPGGAARKHAEISSSSHITIRDSYFYGSSPSSEGYGIDWILGTADSLAENNIFHHMAGPMVLETAEGNIYAYNYATDDYYAGWNGVSFTAPNWNQGSEDHHDAGDMYNLWEGNIDIGFQADDIHGPSFANTAFRNRYSGLDPVVDNGCPAPGCGTMHKTQNTIAWTDGAYDRYDNSVGNVLGTSGYHTTYSVTGCSVGPPSVTVFVLGCPTGTYGTDSLVPASIMRWGNYDTVNAAVRTVSGENASTASTYPGLNTPSTTWASYASLYLASQPSWWTFPSGSTAPFPGIGPEVTSGNIANTGGHAWLNPAANCYLNKLGGLTTGATGSLGASFDAANCYVGGSSPPVSAPTFSPSPGAYGAAQTITLSTSTGGATLCYTLDGTTPTANGAGTCTHGSVYSIPVVISSTTTVKAIGSESGFTDSTISTALYTINGNAAAPTFAPGAGSYGPAQTVTISSTTSGATICFTTNGSNPTADGAGTCTSGTTYSVPVSVTVSETLKAIASKAAFLDSSVASAAYVINGAASTPTFSPVAGSYGPTQNVTISSSTAGSTICYTTNGSSPASSSPGVCAAGSMQYASPVAVASSLTLKAIATKAGWSDSSIGSAAYTINGAVANPTFSPVAGAYGAAQSVTISTATGSAVLCYTTDGSTPTTNGGGTCTHGTTYSGAITVSTSQTVQAIGTKAGFSDSAVSSATYAINGTLPTPTFAPAGGSYGTTQSVTISAASGSPVVVVNTMQETSNANDTIGSTVHRNTYTNCIATCAGGSPAPSPFGTLWCTAAIKSSPTIGSVKCPSFASNGVVSSTISGTGTTALDNGNGAGGTDSLTSVTATYGGTTGTDCGVHGASASNYISGLTFPDPGSSAQLINGVQTGSPGNSSDLTVSKYNSNGDTGRYVARRDCWKPSSTSIAGSHYELDFNYNTLGGTYMGIGQDYDIPNKHWRAGPQSSPWIVEELCPVGGGACSSNQPLPVGTTAVSVELYAHWDAGCTYSSPTACVYYDGMCLEYFNGGTSMGAQQCYNVRNASTHAVISFIPINKTSWTHPQYAIQHQWDINASSQTLTATVDYSTAVAYYTTSGSATICYTTDGTTPTGNGAGSCTHGTAYTGTPLTISTTTTVKAIATQAGFTDSSVGSATYTINGAAATPTFSPVAGTYATAQTITISSSTAGATLCYTSDGSTPTADGNGTCTHGTTVTGTVLVASSLTLKAIASKAGFTDSAVGSAAYVITTPPSAVIIRGLITITGAGTIR